jgi:hypothetical protein
MTPSNKDKKEDPALELHRNVQKRATLHLSKLQAKPVGQVRRGKSVAVVNEIKAMEERGVRKTCVDWSLADMDDMDIPSGFGWDDDAKGNDWKTTTGTSMANGERQVVTEMVKSGYGDEPAKQMEFPIIDVAQAPDESMVASVGQWKFDGEAGWVDTGNKEADAVKPKEVHAAVDVAEFDAKRRAALEADLNKNKSITAHAKKEVIAGVNTTDYNSVANKLHDPKLDSAVRSSVRVQVLSDGVLGTKRDKAIKVEFETVEVRKGGGTRKKTTAKLAPVEKK